MPKMKAKNWRCRIMSGFFWLSVIEFIYHFLIELPIIIRSTNLIIRANKKERNNTSEKIHKVRLKVKKKPV